MKLNIIYKVYFAVLIDSGENREKIPTCNGGIIVPLETGCKKFPISKMN